MLILEEIEEGTQLNQPNPTLIALYGLRQVCQFLALSFPDRRLSKRPAALM
jgi:hypothetical protein